MSESKLVVAICTYRRPELLRGLLRSLQERLDETDTQTDASVLIVDNDPDGSAADVVRDELPTGRYVQEPTPGIAAARACALKNAADADLLVFIDDDEIPRPGWLPELVATWRATGAAAVFGRVVTELPADLDPWLHAMGYFHRPTRTTGEVVPAAATNNLLLDLHQVKQAGVRFDPSMGLAGGEDTLFTRQLIARGGTIVYCAESVVDSPLTDGRHDREWALERVYGHANSDVDIALRLSGGTAGQLRTRAKWFAKGSAKVAIGSVRHQWGRLRGNMVHDARGLRMARGGRGNIAGALGRRHEEYSRSDANLDED